MDFQRRLTLSHIHPSLTSFVVAFVCRICIIIRVREWNARAEGAGKCCGWKKYPQKPFCKYENNSPINRFPRSFSLSLSLCRQPTNCCLRPLTNNQRRSGEERVWNEIFDIVARNWIRWWTWTFFSFSSSLPSSSPLDYCFKSARWVWAWRFYILHVHSTAGEEGCCGPRFNFTWFRSVQGDERRIRFSRTFFIRFPIELSCCDVEHWESVNARRNFHNRFSFAEKNIGRIFTPTGYMHRIHRRISHSTQSRVLRLSFSSSFDFWEHNSVIPSL